MLIFNDKHLWIRMFLHFRGGKLPETGLRHRISNRQKKQLFKRNFPLGFLYLEHRASVLAAVTPSFFPHNIPGVNENFFGLVSCYLKLDKTPGDKKSLKFIGRIHRRYGFSYAANHFTRLSA